MDLEYRALLSQMASLEIHNGHDEYKKTFMNIIHA